MDQKSGKCGLTNVIFSDMQDKFYHDRLRRLQSMITFQYALPQEELLAITKVIAELKKTCSNISTHQIVWAQNIHLVEKLPYCIPPMRVPRNFSLEDMPLHIQLKLEKANIRIKLVSDFLYGKKVPQFDTAKSSQQDMFDLLAEIDLDIILS